MIKYLILLFTVLMSSCASSDSSEIIIFSNKVTSGQGYFWGKSLFNQERNVCAVIKNQGSQNDGWSADSIFIFSKDKGYIIINCALEEGHIIKLHSISDDGKNLLVDLHYKINGSYKTKPVIFDINSRKFTDIKI